MSFRIGNTIVIRPMDDAECEQCHQMAECRPYGPGGTAICYECGQTMKDVVEHNMGVQLLGVKGELR